MTVLVASPSQETSAEQQAVQQAIKCALADTSALAVVRLPPGAGKSTLARKEAVQRILDGHLNRILWAVRETTSETSLGREALEDFEKQTVGTGIRCDLVLGRKAAPDSASYIGSLEWPAEPCIKVISHAHLSLLMDASLPTSALSAAELLFIDEDPASSLIANHTFRLNALKKRCLPGDRISQFLLSVDVPSVIEESGTSYQTFDGRKGMKAWLGDPFWKALRQHRRPVTEDDLEAFIATLAG